MSIDNLHALLLIVQRSISLCGVFVILVGVVNALARYLIFCVSTQLGKPTFDINRIRLNLGRVLTLGLEFIVAADLISTTTAPDYYTVGMVAIIIIIRTVLSYSLNREINAISEIEAKNKEFQTT